MFPDDVLLEIFELYVDDDMVGYLKKPTERWITLVHVCRRWRSVVFQSPHRLNLRLFCTPKTRARDTLDIWPPFPLIIRGVSDVFGDEPSSVDNIIAALEHNDRVCQIKLINLTGSKLGYLKDSAAMHKSFPELTHLWLGRREYEYDGTGRILPNSFLGGTAPRLRSLISSNVPFPGFPKLLLSATHIVRLDLLDIPRSGYFPPEAMATSLSALTSLESLYLEFRYPRPHPALESRRLPLPPLTRSILPSLTIVRFKGASEYLEVISAQIDAPRLNELHITFFNQIIFNTPQLFQFISRGLTLRGPEKGYIAFNSEAIIVKFRSQISEVSMQIRCTASEWQLSSIEQVCASSLPPVSTLEDLYISEIRYWRPRWQDDVENTLWLELFRSFVTVKNLYLSEEFVPRIAPALQELVRGRTTEVLPSVENIFLEGFQPSGPLHKGIEKFVAARRLASRPVAVSPLDRESHWEIFDR